MEYPGLVVERRVVAYVLYPLIAIVSFWMSAKRSPILLGAAALLVALEGNATWVYPSSHMPVPAARILLAFSLGCIVYLISKRTANRRLNGWLGVTALGLLLWIPAIIPVGGLPSPQGGRTDHELAACGWASCQSVQWNNTTRTSR